MDRLGRLMLATILGLTIAAGVFIASPMTACGIPTSGGFPPQPIAMCATFDGAGKPVTSWLEYADGARLDLPPSAWDFGNRVSPSRSLVPVAAAPFLVAGLFGSFESLAWLRQRRTSRPVRLVT